MMTILVGMIASGKDTFVQLLADRGTLVVNDDDIVNAVHGGVYTRHRKSYKCVYLQIELSIICAAINGQLDVVINRPNFKKSTRERYIGIAKAANMPVNCVVFPREKSVIHASRRFNSDPRGLSYDQWVNVAATHEAQWEEPTMDEGFDNIIPADVAKEMILSGKW